MALPVREISAESVRDKYLPSFHPKHLHVWWARRPMAAARAVVFASLVPDPDDSACPAVFLAAVNRRLRTDVSPALEYYRRGRSVHHDADPFRPYDGVEDTPRNRLLTFIAKWSPESLEFEAGKRRKAPSPKELLDDRSLVKWETSDPKNLQGREVLRIARELVRAAHNDKVPTVLDSFAGGGAIPLEAGRLGCHAIASEYNPVAHLILRATCEWPQKYGKSGTRTAIAEEFGREVKRDIKIPNVLVHDIEKWANWVLERVRQKVGHLYPAGKDGRAVLAYLWARTTPCSNPSCQGDIPLMRSLVVRSKARKVAITLDIDRPGKQIRFGIAKGSEIKRTEGTKRARGPAICPFCDQPTSEDEIRTSSRAGRMGEQMVCVVVDGVRGKDYRPVEERDLCAIEDAQTTEVEIPAEYIVPEINGPGASPDAGSHRSISLELYGFTRWGQLFNRRQLVLLNSFIQSVRDAIETLVVKGTSDDDYKIALASYLGLWIDRIAMFSNSFCRWESGLERPKTPFGGQSIPMMWDFPEINPLGTLAGTATTQLRYMTGAIEREARPDGSAPIIASLVANASNLAVSTASVNCCVTDPPYGNSIAYADLSDFFYVWLKRSLGDVHRELFLTPQTPKEEEVTSHKHRHCGSQREANKFYQQRLSESLRESKRVVADPKFITVMFAHQSTDAWTALISALFEAGLSPNATWPIATEMPTTALALGTASLETSVTVACRPRVAGSAVSFRQIRSEIQDVVRQAVRRFWSYGFRGADLIVACYGPAVGVFGKYERVERADGTPVDIPELLDLARQAARDAIAGEFRGDSLSTLYYVWANLYGAAEQAWDDARLVVQIGGDEDNAMEVARGHGIFVLDGARCRLALLDDRASRRGLGIDQNPPHIDALHRSMLLWKEEQRKNLVDYLAQRDLLEDDPFWKLAQALFEVLPRDLEDWKLVNALLGERRTLRAEGKSTEYRDAQARLFAEGGDSS